MRKMKNENGFTLAEIMVAFAILIMASQLLISGFAVARKMEHRASELSCTADVLKENILDDSECISGTLKMKVDKDTELSGDGWLYQNRKMEESNIVINAVRVDGRS